MTIRVFASGPLSAEQELTLEPEESHYAVRVRRAKAGDRLEVLDGHREAFIGTVLEASAREAKIRLEASVLPPAIPFLEIAVAKPDAKAAIEVLARACEGGAGRLTWITSTRSQPHGPALPRIERVLRAAMRQCGRPTLLEVGPATSLSEWLVASHEPAWIAAPSRPSRGSAPGFVEGVGPKLGTAGRVLVGPEGGFTDEEVDAAVAAGFWPLCLGPWILRTEVAVTAALGRLLGL